MRKTPLQANATHVFFTTKEGRPGALNYERAVETTPKFDPSKFSAPRSNLIPDDYDDVAVSENDCDAQTAYGRIMQGNGR